MAPAVILSSDSHVFEPPDLWAKRIDRAFRDRAPRIQRIDGADQIVIETDQILSGIGLISNAGARFEAPETISGDGRFEDVPRGGYDPEQHLADMRLDGVAGEVLYPSQGLFYFRIADSALMSAIFRAYNDWLADFCAADPKRLKGIAMINLDDVQEGIAELERAARLGLAGAMITEHPLDHRRYDQPEYEPFWAAAQELDMKMSLHSLTSKRQNSDPARGDMLFRSILLYQEVARTMTDLIIHGVLEKFPTLKFISAENEIAWIPFHLWRMDQLHEKLYTMSPVNLPMKPSDYFNRQFYATFIEDPMFASTTSTMGVDNIMWSSDFPHLASTYPHSRKFIEENLAGLSATDQRKIVHDNVAKLYDISL